MQPLTHEGLTTPWQLCLSIVAEELLKVLFVHKNKNSEQTTMLFAESVQG